MAFSDVVSFVRRRWHVILPVAVVICLLIYLIANLDDPREVARRYGREFGYYIILGWTFLEGETIVVIMGLMANELELHPAIIALCAFIGSFCSDQLMFSLGKYKGESVLRYFPRVARNVDKAAVLFKKYDTLLILGFRFVYGVRNVTPILLGISGVSHPKFFILNFIGGGVWALTFAYGGYYAGQMFESVMHRVGHGIFYVLAGVIVVGGALWFFRARSNVKTAGRVSGVDPAVLKKRIAAEQAASKTPVEKTDEKTAESTKNPGTRDAGRRE